MACEMPQRKAAGATSDTSENVELASECLATLLELAPVLSASEQAVLQLQVRHSVQLGATRAQFSDTRLAPPPSPCAPPGWLDGLPALAAGRPPEDVRLLDALERQLAAEEAAAACARRSSPTRTRRSSAPTPMPRRSGGARRARRTARERGGGADAAPSAAAAPRARPKPSPPASPAL